MNRGLLNNLHSMLLGCFNLEEFEALSLGRHQKTAWKAILKCSPPKHNLSPRVTTNICHRAFEKFNFVIIIKKFEKYW